MKVNVVMSDRLQILVSAENELEVLVLKQLASSGPVEIVMQEKIQMGDKALQDTIIIAKKAAE